MRINRRELFNGERFALEAADPRRRREVFREALHAGRERIRQGYLKGAAPEDVMRSLAWLVDQLIVHAWERHQDLLPADAVLALVAVGGYGRGELAPASDIDLMLLVEKNRYRPLQAFFEAFLQFLWDMGLEVGHSVRSLK